MNNRQIQNIVHSQVYNPGGVSGIYLIDYDKFHGYVFQNGNHYDSCFVEKIETQALYVEVDRVDESTYTESYENGVYKQRLTGFIGTLTGNKLANMLRATTRKYVVVFRNLQGKGYTFGSDGGARFSFGQQSGQVGEPSGYTISFDKNSIYPLFEMNVGQIEEQEIMRFFDDTFDQKFN